MYVDEEKAKILERIATYASETFYFCSDGCKREFEKAPKKFAGKEKTVKKVHDHAALPEAGHDHSNMKKDKSGALDRDEPAPKDKPADSAKTRVPAKAKRDAMDMAQPQAAMPGIEDDSEETREGPYPFPGAQYLGTVPRDPAPAEGVPPKDRLPPRQFEIPAAPPTGTRLK